MDRLIDIFMEGWMYKLMHGLRDRLREGREEQMNGWDRSD